MGVIMFRISGELSTASGIDQAVQLSSALTKGTLIACIVIVRSKVALFEYSMDREITGSFDSREYGSNAHKLSSVILNAFACTGKTPAG